MRENLVSFIPPQPSCVDARSSPHGRLVSGSAQDLGPLTACRRRNSMCCCGAYNCRPVQPPFGSKGQRNPFYPRSEVVVKWLRSQRTKFFLQTPTLWVREIGKNARQYRFPRTRTRPSTLFELRVTRETYARTRTVVMVVGMEKKKR